MPKNARKLRNLKKPPLLSQVKNGKISRKKKLVTPLGKIRSALTDHVLCKKY